LCDNYNKPTTTNIVKMRGTPPTNTNTLLPTASFHISRDPVSLRRSKHDFLVSPASSSTALPALYHLALHSRGAFCHTTHGLFLKRDANASGPLLASVLTSCSAFSITVTMASSEKPIAFSQDSWSSPTFRLAHKYLWKQMGQGERENRLAQNYKLVEAATGKIVAMWSRGNKRGTVTFWGGDEDWVITVLVGGMAVLDMLRRPRNRNIN
jgi:hypothetical protein